MEYVFSPGELSGFYALRTLYDYAGEIGLERIINFARMDGTYPRLRSFRGLRSLDSKHKDNSVMITDYSDNVAGFQIQNPKTHKLVQIDISLLKMSAYPFDLRSRVRNRLKYDISQRERVLCLGHVGAEGLDYELEVVHKVVDELGPLFDNLYLVWNVDSTSPLKKLRKALKRKNVYSIETGGQLRDLYSAADISLNFQDLDGGENHTRHNFFEMTESGVYVTTPFARRDHPGYDFLRELGLIREFGHLNEICYYLTSSEGEELMNVDQNLLRERASYMNANRELYCGEILRLIGEFADGGSDLGSNSLYVTSNENILRILHPTFRWTEKDETIRLEA